ncbi:MAG: sulfurtransferase TusA [Pseudomonadota bacterium]|nr:sulfurtransferase TusA [Pseudomonadota bacterium]
MKDGQNVPSSTQRQAEETAVLDAKGLYCPEPVMLLHNKVRDLPGGGLLKVLATDPSTERDIPKFCVFLGHELIEATRDDTLFTYVIKKKADG